MFSWVSALLGSVLVATAFAASDLETPALRRVDIAEWSANPGTQLLVDTQSGSGYLLNIFQRTYFEFPVATGKRGTVCHAYLGCYNGKTPDADWIIRGDIEIKGHAYFRTKENTPGRFFRFYRLLNENGEIVEKKSPYGLHTYRTVEEELAQGRRAWTFGCVVAPDATLDVIEDAYQKNGGALSVKTRFGNPFEPTLFAHK